MSKKLRNILLIILLVLIVCVALILGIYLSSQDNTTIVNGVVIKIDDDYTYEQVLLKSYDEYNELLDEFGIDEVILTNNSFLESDYIVDYIYYDSNLELYNIEVNLSDYGISINYVVNQDVYETDEYLMYFIPIDKDIISELNIYKISYEIEQN